MSNRTHLTVTKIKALKATGKDFIMWDNDPTGLGVKVTKKGTKSYIINYRIRHRERRFKIGAVDKWTLEEARVEAKRLFVKIAGGYDPLEAKRADQQIGTVEEMVCYWRDHYAKSNLKPASLENLDSMIRVYWTTSNILPRQHRIHKLHLSDVKKIHFIDLHKYITIEMGYPSVADRMVKTILQAWNWSTENLDDLPPPPFSKFKGLNKLTKRNITLYENDFPAIYDAVTTRMKYGTLSFSTGYLIIWLMLTGVRESEGRMLKWNDIDDKIGVIHTTDKVLKTKQIFLNDTLLKLLKKIKEEQLKRNIITSYVFQSPYSKSEKPLAKINSQFDTSAIAIGRPELTIHDLRRSFIAVGRNEIAWTEEMVSMAVQHKKKDTTSRLYPDTSTKRESAIYNIIVDEIANMSGFNERKTELRSYEKSFWSLNTPDVSVDPNKIYTDKQTAYHTGLTVRQLKRWREKGRKNLGPVFFKKGRKVRYKGSDILAWQKNQQRAA